MPTERIPFGNDQRSGDSQLAGASPLAINVLVDGAGAVRRRPGIGYWSGMSSSPPASDPIIGITSFAGDIYYVSSTRRIFRVFGPEIGTAELSAYAEETLLDGERRPVFAETPWRLVIAGGGALQKVDREFPSSARLGGDPPHASQVAAFTQRVFANTLSLGNVGIGRVQYSQAGDAGTETWPTLNFKIAEGRPDGITALKENGGELFVFGDTSLQIYSPDAISVIAPGRSLNRGCAAADSVIAADEAFAWLDERRNFVISDGRGLNEISAPIAGTLDAIADVSDCWGFRFVADQFSCLAWVLPTDGRTFVNQEGGGWCQWQSYNDPTGHAPLAIHSHYYWPEQNLNLVGLSNGRIGVFDFSYVYDYNSNASRIKAEVHTGFLDRGTTAKKHCQVVRFVFRRGVSAGNPGSVLVSWRDDLGAFCDPIRLSLGRTGDNFVTQEIRSAGVYRARQWKLEFADAGDFVLAKAEETFAVGGTN